MRGRFPSSNALRTGNPCEENPANQRLERGTIVSVNPDTLTCDVITTETQSRLTGLAFPNLLQDPQGSGGHIEVPRPGTQVYVQRGLGIPFITGFQPVSVSSNTSRATSAVILGLSGRSGASPRSADATYLGALPSGLKPGDWLHIGNQGQFLGLFDQGTVGLYAGPWSHVLATLEDDTLNMAARNFNLRVGAGNLICRDYGGKQSVLLQLGTDQMTETGTGKELAARAIQRQSRRAEQPFVPVNCGAIPSELMESEFFGHKKGSFTGAIEDKQGLFQAANGGTLFLDEVADLPLPMQVKLLRAIQEKAVRAVGGQQEVVVDVRILCATHKDLAAEVAAGRFRQDLYYRLNVIELRVPPLRERREDIAQLADVMLARLADGTGLAAAKLHPDALEKLKNYRFPGNVRELENMLERAYTLCEDDQITPSDLRLADASGPGSEGGETSLAQIDNLEDYLEDIERKLIMQALEETRWNRTAAAQRLGLTFRSMRYRLKKLGID